MGYSLGQEEKGKPARAKEGQSRGMAIDRAAVRVDIMFLI